MFNIFLVILSLLRFEQHIFYTSIFISRGTQEGDGYLLEMTV